MNIKCDRCNSKSYVKKMSMFNTQMCCMLCIEIEKRHPDYDRASKEELKHCKNKNFNFKGVGLPKDFYIFSKGMERSVKKEMDNRYF